MPCVEILVVETRGSAPREAGARMWVSATDARGTIGGGNLEYTALKIAREMLLSGEAHRERKFALGDSLGQCCGGSVVLRFSMKDSIEEKPEEAFQVMLGRLPCKLTWTDPRPEVFPSAVERNVEVSIEEDPAWIVDEAPPGAYFLVMTHSHALDLDIVERVLRRGDYGFLGLIGSETKAAKFKLRLRQKNLSTDRLVCPIGLVKAGKHPAAVAVSVVAQLLSLTATSAREARAPLRSSQ
jgi:xanthine dehydrogenase accessory factor